MWRLWTLPSSTASLKQSPKENGASNTLRRFHLIRISSLHTNFVSEPVLSNQQSALPSSKPSLQCFVLKVNTSDLS